MTIYEVLGGKGGGNGDEGERQDRGQAAAATSKSYHIVASAELNSVELVATPEQICSLATALALSETRQTWQELIFYRPTFKRNMRRLWQFAIKAVMDVIRVAKRRHKSLARVITVIEAGKFAKYARQFTLSMRPPSRARTWWKYAINAVIRALRKAKRAGADTKFRVFTDTLIRKSKYASLYSRVIGAKIIASVRQAQERESKRQRLANTRVRKRPVRVDADEGDESSGNDEDRGPSTTDSNRRSRSIIDEIDSTSHDRDSGTHGTSSGRDGSSTSSSEEGEEEESSTDEDADNSFHLIRTPVKAIRRFFASPTHSLRKVPGQSSNEDPSRDQDDGDGVEEDDGCDTRVGGEGVHEGSVGMYDGYYLMSPGPRATSSHKDSPGTRPKRFSAFAIPKQHEHLNALSEQEMHDLEDCYEELTMTELEVPHPNPDPQR